MKKRLRLRIFISQLLAALFIFQGSATAAPPCKSGQIIGAVSEDFGEDIAPRLLESAKHIPDGADVAANILRASSGISRTRGKLFDVAVFLRGKEFNAGFTSLAVGKTLEGRTFSSFEQFRRQYWKSVAESKYAREVTEEAIVRMRAGKAPAAPLSQHIGKREVYELHHATPIHRGGDVYDPSNIMVVTPKFHKEVLNVDYHFGYGG